MQVNSGRIGRCEVDERWVFRFVAPILGFEGRVWCAVLDIPQYQPLRWLQSLEDSQLCLPVMDALVARPDYEVDLSDSDARLLRLERAEDAWVLVVVVLAEELEGVRVNLRAPIVCNLNERLAMQVVLNDARYPIRGRLMVSGASVEDGATARAKKEVFHAGA